MVARPGIEPGTQGFSIQKTMVFLSSHNMRVIANKAI